MINRRALSLTRTEKLQNNAVFNLIEFGYLLYLFYNMFSQAFNIAFANVGAIWLAGLGVVCLPLVNWRGMQAKLLFFVVAIAASHILIQILVFHRPLDTIYILGYFWWIFLATIISTLMQRPGFFQRLIVCLALCALIWSPFVKSYTVAGVTRIELDAGNSLNNSNDYAQWIGFCSMVLWIWSLKKVNRNTRLTLRSGTILGLILALRAVSRGFLITVGTTFLTSLRKLRIFRAVLVIVFVSGLGAYLVYQVPFFHQILSAYTMRFVEPTSRINVFFLGLRAIAANPLIGYGVQNLKNVLPITPHNELLLLWISSGILPAVIFIIFVIYTFVLAVRFQKNDRFFDPLALIVFIIFNIPLTNTVMTKVWAIGGIAYIYTIGDWLRAEQKALRLAPTGTNPDPLNSKRR